MLLFTKRGKQFYHIISTEAHLALRRGDIPHYQRLRWGLHVTLTALADKLQAELAGKTPEQGGSSSSSGRRLAGHKRPHSRSSSRWSADVLWILHTYCLFHTHWSSTRSPPYDGTLLTEVAAELFGFEVRNSV
ncbi:hypothetical protein OEZ86_000989 [Tetradesmus obliquus]|nr:hypothetical protein OEZ86_000989 [Tetradesmus obliquus]